LNEELTEEAAQRRAVMAALAESEARLRALFDTSAVGIAVDDMEGRFVETNPAYQEIVGYSDQELRMMSFVEITHPDDIDADLQLFNELVAGERDRYDIEKRYIHKSGRVVWIHLTVSVIRDADERPRFPIGFVQDITDRKRLEAVRDQFIADAAHELRTPLTTLTGFTELLADRERLSPEELDTALGALHRQGARLRSLVNNLLDLTRLQNGGLKVNLAPVPVGPLVEEVLESAPPPDGYSVETVLDEEVVALADRHRLDQILTNLLTNAYRYGGRNIKVATLRDNGSAEVVVADDGSGVPDEFVPQLFEPFTRGDNGAGVDGSGLGLAIVQMLAQACGGVISYERNEPTGARFVVRLQPA